MLHFMAFDHYVPDGFVNVVPSFLDSKGLQGVRASCLKRIARRDGLLHPGFTVDYL